MHMSTNVEIEAKALVSKDEYLKLFNHFLPLTNKAPYTQTNFYIDTKTFALRKDGSGLRIRKIKENYNMTLKVPLSYGLLEKNQEITFEEFQLMEANNRFPDGNIKEFLIMLGYDVNNLTIFASLTTSRLDYRYKSSLLSIDKNSYNGKVDYEIEMEDNSPLIAKQNLIEVLALEDIPFRENKKSKVVRASEK